MTQRLATICFVTMFLIGLAAPSARAQGKTSAAMLKGVGTVSVVVENLQDGAKTLNLTRETIRTDVGLKLRLAGMRVVTDEESLKLSGSPFVSISVTLADGSLTLS